MQRKRNRLVQFDYSSYATYFITICTSERKNYFWENAVALITDFKDVELSMCGKTVENAINKLSQIYPLISVEHYVIMPDHVHLLLRYCADENGRALHAPTLSHVIGHLKGYVTKQIGYSVWQKSFFDHIVRNKEDYDEPVKYITENPMRWCYKHFGVDEQY